MCLLELLYGSKIELFAFLTAIW